jgi:hypothetical protein
MILEFFPPVVQALNLEVAKHPLLLSSLSQMASTNGGRLDMEMMVGAVAAYCNVELDGSPLLEEDLEALFNLLLVRLQRVSALTVN